MSDTVEREGVTEDRTVTNNEEGIQPAQQEGVISGGAEVPVSDDLFLGAGVCQTQPQNDATPLDYVPMAAVQERTEAAAMGLFGMHGGGGSLPQEVPLDLPFSHPPEGGPSESTWMEMSPWRREYGSMLPMMTQPNQNSYMQTRPTRMATGSRFPYAPSSVAGSAALNGFAPPLHQGLGLDAARSIRNGTCSVCTSQGIQRGGVSRREDIYRLSQNPWGPNTIFGPRSMPTDMHSWQIMQGDHSYEPDCVFHSEGTLPYHLVRKDEQQPFSMYSKYRRRHGVVRRARKKIVEVGGRLCQSFLVWVLFVATLAGVEGFKGKSESLQNAGRKVDWSDSEPDSENDSHSRFSVLAFKG